MEFFGYLGAFFIGIVIGLTGGGGSILTVPLLVYVMGYNPVVSAAYSLWMMLFHQDKNILVIATKQDTAKNLVTKVRVMHANLPSGYFFCFWSYY